MMKLLNKIFQNMAIVLMAIMLLATFSVPALAGIHVKTVAEGVAPVQSENIAGARQAAIQDALRQAVEQEAGMLMNATSIVKNDDLMEKIYTNTEGYITGYEILREKREKNGLYRVKVQATIKIGALRDTLVKLGIIKAMMDYPRVMVLPYPDESISPESRIAETVIIKYLSDKRFDVVDPGKSSELHQEAKELLKVDTVENVAARVGLKHHAEIVILYGLHAGAAEFDGIMEQVPVSLRSQAVVTTTAQILTAEEQSISGVGKTGDLARKDGARRVAENLVQPMMQNIVSWWSDYTSNGLPYVVTLHTKPGADRLVIAFEKALESITGVVSLAERSSGGGITEMMVKYKGNSAMFKREILDAFYAADGFKNLHTVASKGRFLAFSTQKEKE